MDSRISEGLPLENNNSTVFSGATVVVPAYMAAIAAGEALGLLFGAVPGMLCHALLIPVLLSHYGLGDQAPYRGILPVLALAPLLRIVSLSLPLEGVPQIYWYAMIGAPLLIAVALTARLLDLSWSHVGLRRSSWRPQLAIAVSGLPLGIAAFLLLQPKPLVAGFSWRDVAIGAAILLIFTGFAEEILFRGMLQHVAKEVFGRAGVLCSSVLFAIMYIGSPSLSYLLFISLLGVFFGWCVERTGSIWGIALAHGILNIALFLILPYLAEGLVPIITMIVPWLMLGGAAVLAIGLGVIVSGAGAARTPRPAEGAPAKKLRALRRAQGLSYVELAQRTGLRARLLAEIEHGLRPPESEQLHLIAAALGVEPRMLAPADAQYRRPDARGFALVPPLPGEATMLDAAHQGASSFV